jgi:hypothetical protein
VICNNNIQPPQNSSDCIFRVSSDPIKRYVLGKLGHPHVRVEINDDQLNDIIRVGASFIAQYFEGEQRLAVFNTVPLQSTYPMPSDAWIVQNVDWDPFVGTIADVFDIRFHMFNNVNLSNFNTLVLDYHLLQHFRRHTAKILGSEGRWEVINETSYVSQGDELSANKQLIRLFPTPKSVYPVVVTYVPCVTSFKTPTSRQLTYDFLVAEAMIMVGMVRRKITGTPTPDGGSLSYDGEALIKEGMDMRNKIMEDILKYDEPLPIIAI